MRNNNDYKIINTFRLLPQLRFITCICACAGSVCDLCCCDSKGRHSLDDTTVVASCTARSYSVIARSCYLWGGNKSAIETN